MRARHPALVLPLDRLTEGVGGRVGVVETPLAHRERKSGQTSGAEAGVHPQVGAEQVAVPVHRAPPAARQAPVIPRAPDGHARAGRGPAPGAREGADAARGGPGAVATGPGEREGEAPPVEPLLPRPRAVLDGLLVRLEEAGECHEHVRGGHRAGGGPARGERLPDAPTHRVHRARGHRPGEVGQDGGVDALQTHPQAVQHLDGEAQRRAVAVGVGGGEGPGGGWRGHRGGAGEGAGACGAGHGGFGPRQPLGQDRGQSRSGERIGQREVAARRRGQGEGRNLQVLHVALRRHLRLAEGGYQVRHHFEGEGERGAIAVGVGGGQGPGGFLRGHGGRAGEGAAGSAAARGIGRGGVLKPLGQGPGRPGQRIGERPVAAGGRGQGERHNLQALHVALRRDRPIAEGGLQVRVARRERGERHHPGGAHPTVGRLVARARHRRPTGPAVVQQPQPPLPGLRAQGCGHRQAELQPPGGDRLRGHVHHRAPLGALPEPEARALQRHAGRGRGEAQHQVPVERGGQHDRHPRGHAVHHHHRHRVSVHRARGGARPARRLHPQVRCVVVGNRPGPGRRVGGEGRVHRGAQRDHHRLVRLLLRVAGHRHVNRPRGRPRREGERPGGERRVVLARRGRAGARVRVGYRHLPCARGAQGHREAQGRRDAGRAFRHARGIDRHRGRIIVWSCPDSVDREGLGFHAASWSLLSKTIGDC